MYNKIIMMGRLTDDPKVYTKTENESTRTTASYVLAVTRSYNKELTDFFRCVTFGKKAEFADKYLKKGMKILVEGSLYTDSYTDEEGRKIRTSAIYVDKHIFCEKKNDNQEFREIPDEDIPFDNSQEPGIPIPDNLGLDVIR
jgi:single-strand DNA-binding protein